MRTPTRHLLIISSDQELCDSLATPLTAAGYALHWLAGAIAPNTRVFAQNVQAVILDLDPDNASAASFLGRLMQIAGNRCLVITGRGRADQRIMALQAGARAVLSRPVPVTEIVARLAVLAPDHKTAGGAGAFFPAPDLVIDSDNSVVAGHEGVAHLTAQETIMLRYLAQAAAHAAGHQLLCDILGLSVEKKGILALRQAVARLRRKLKASRVSSLDIVAERHRGYRLVVQESAGDDTALSTAVPSPRRDAEKRRRPRPQASYAAA